MRASTLTGLNLLALMLVTLGATTAQAESDLVSWKRIVGIIVPFNAVGIVQGVGAPWSTTRGRAHVNLATGNIGFDVEGLVLAANPLPTTVIGTPGAVTMVKGTLVCDLSNGGTVLVDTPAVPLSAQGDADFQGNVALPAACTTMPNDMAFLIRVVAAPGNPLLVDRWNAHGAVRKP